MTPVTSFSGKSVAVFGLGGSGLASCRALAEGGASVVAFDDNATSVDAARAAGIATQDLKQADWSKIDALVLAPGVPLTHPKPHWTVDLAQAHKVEIIGDIELFCRQRAKEAPGSPFVAITGTNGKSTTTALTGHILKSAGWEVQVGGNLGTPVLALDPPKADRCHVVEMSSYQIELTPSLDPTVGIMLNVTPDHLDRHGTMQHYAELKEIVPARARHAVVGVDDEYGRAIVARLIEKKRDVTPVSTTGLIRRGYVAGASHLYRVAGTDAEEVADLQGIGSLRGAHNAQNAMAAFAACSALGLADGEIREGLRSFPGLAHRMEEVGRRGRVLFVNDSKATNADSTARALASFDGNIFWIAGGKPKEGGIASLGQFFSRIRKAYLIGEAAREFARTLEGKVPYEMSGTLGEATAQAARDAAATGEGVVLLSPACASFDQFQNFEKRGDAFRDFVRGLA